MQSDLMIRFPVAGNARLCHGTAERLSHIEVSPYGLHWPELDEELSFRGLLAGDYGQHRACRAEMGGGESSRQL
jgi:hypothetical protein